MQNKLRPGDTFKHEQDGVTYEIRVLSVGDQIDATDRLAQAGDDARGHLQAWLDIVQDNVVSWSRDEPIGDLRYFIDRAGLGGLLDAVVNGNRPSEDDQKN